jgi:hypothetical protein
MSQEIENSRRNSLFCNILPASPYSSIFWAYLDPYQTRKLQKEKILAEGHKKKLRGTQAGIATARNAGSGRSFVLWRWPRGLGWVC